MPRSFGNSVVRIGSSIEVQEDIYCLAFCSQINNKILTNLFDVVKGRIKDETKSDDSNGYVNQINTSLDDVAQSTSIS